MAPPRPGDNLASPFRGLSCRPSFIHNQNSANLIPESQILSFTPVLLLKHARLTCFTQHTERSKSHVVGAGVIDTCFRSSSKKTLISFSYLSARQTSPGSPEAPDVHAGGELHLRVAVSQTGGGAA